MPTLPQRIAEILDTRERVMPGQPPLFPTRHTRRARLTVEDPDAADTSTMWGALGAATRPDSHREWRTRELDDQTLDRITTPDLIKLLIDISPEVNSALYHFVRFCNAGYEIVAYRPNSRNIHRRGQAVLKKLFDRLTEQYGAVNVVIDQMFISAYVGGAFFSELVLAEGYEAVDLVVIDPDTVLFESHRDPVRGDVWVMGQEIDDKFTPLDYPTISYVPVDPFPKGAPYGRPLLTSSIFVSLFLIGLLHDLRRVISQQGYPRMDVSVNLERLVASMPDDKQDDPDSVKAWTDAVLDEVKEAYAALQPDSAFIHTDVVEVKGSVGSVSAHSLGFVDNLISALERMVIRGLKTMPLILGSAETTTETHANRQWEIHAASIKSIQHLAETMLSRLLRVALEAAGIVCDVKVTFAELRASEQLRDEQTRTLLIDNVTKMYNQGWIDQDEAAQMAVGHEPALPEPRTVAEGPAPGEDDPLNVDLEAHPQDDADEEPGAAEDIPDDSPTPHDLDDQRLRIAWRSPGARFPPLSTNL